MVHNSHDWTILIIGLLLGWLFKIPFLLKWYREVKQTKDYKNRRTDAYLNELHRLEELYKPKEKELIKEIKYSNGMCQCYKK